MVTTAGHISLELVCRVFRLVKHWFGFSFFTRRFRCQPLLFWNQDCLWKTQIDRSSNYYITRKDYCPYEYFIPSRLVLVCPTVCQMVWYSGSPLLYIVPSSLLLWVSIALYCAREPVTLGLHCPTMYQAACYSGSPLGLHIVTRSDPLSILPDTDPGYRNDTLKTIL